MVKSSDCSGVTQHFIFNVGPLEIHVKKTGRQGARVLGGKFIAASELVSKKDCFVVDNALTFIGGNSKF